MPETTVVTPAAVVPADRLTLGSCDARAYEGGAPLWGLAGVWNVWICMAEE